MLKFSRYLIFFIIAICIFVSTKVDIANAGVNIQRLITIIVDVSDSMKVNNLNGVIENSLGKFIASLTSNYEVNLIAYNGDIQFNKSMFSWKGRINEIYKFEDIKYGGYSNIGYALKTAVSDIKEDIHFKPIQKDIIIISDNDIFMQNETETEKTRSLFKEQVSIAKDLGIDIHSIEFGNMYPEENILIQASQETGGLYFNTEEMNIDEIFNSLLRNQFHVKKFTTETFEYSEGILPITINVPKYASEIKVIVSSDKPIKKLDPVFDYKESDIMSQTYVSSLILYDNEEDEYKIEFQGEPGATVKLDVIIEYSMQGYTYIKNKLRKVDGKLAWKNVTTNRLILRESDNYTFENIFKDKYFESFTIYLTTNDETLELRFKRGQLYWEVPFVSGDEQQIILDFSSLPINIFYGSDDIFHNPEHFVLKLTASEGSVQPIKSKM